MDRNLEDRTKELLASRSEQYRNAENSWDKIKEYVGKAQLLFASEKVKNFVFGPIKSALHIGKELDDPDIYAIITQVAVANAVMAGLPGKMGVGVFVSLALETWMAYSIAKRVGLDVKTPRDVLKYFSLIVGSLVLIFEGFRVLLGFAFSLFSFVPMINPMILPELFVTDFVGILLLVGFREAKDTGSFTVPKRIVWRLAHRAKDLAGYQWNILKRVLNANNLKTIQKRLAAWFKGDVAFKTALITDDAFTGIAMGIWWEMRPRS